jgi:DNA-directed RNA polymerase specialized sigma subunit
VSPENDALSAELVRLEDEIDEAATSLHQARLASREVREHRRRGRPYVEVVRESARPLQFLHRALDRLRPAAARVRRAEMQVLRAEGATTTQIAEHFGISHQRVSRLLSQVEAPPPPPVG